MRVPSAVSAILAHQGGWDEMLLVAAPIALLAGVLWLANRRANRIQAAARAAAAEPGEPGSAAPEPEHAPSDTLPSDGSPAD